MYIPDRFNHQYGIPLIMEIGSLNTKIGFAGKDRPDVIAPSVPTLFILSMFRRISSMVKSSNLIFSNLLLKKDAILKVFSKIVLLKIGRDFKY